MKVNLKDKPYEIFYKNFIAGTGWVFGVTVGFTILISFLGFVFNTLGGLPIIGEFVASLVEVTQNALINKGF